MALWVPAAVLLQTSLGARRRLQQRSSPCLEMPYVLTSYETGFSLLLIQNWSPSSKLGRVFVEWQARSFHNSPTLGWVLGGFMTASARTVVLVAQEANSLLETEECPLLDQGSNLILRPRESIFLAQAKRNSSFLLPLQERHHLLHQEMIMFMNRLLVIDRVIVLPLGEERPRSREIMSC